MLAYAAIAAFYVHRARSRGVGARVLPYVVAGIAAGLVFGIASAWSHQLGVLGYFPTGPISIGLALFVLARVERNWPLLAFAAGYLVVALLASGVGVRRVGPNLGPMWGFLPALVVAGGALLLGGVGFALAERRRP